MFIHRQAVVLHVPVSFAASPAHVAVAAADEELREAGIGHTRQTGHLAVDDLALLPHFLIDASHQDFVLVVAIVGGADVAALGIHDADADDEGERYGKLEADQSGAQGTAFGREAERAF